MTNQEQYDNIWDKADKYDKLIKVLDEIRTGIEQDYKVESEHPYGQGLRKALEIIEKYRESED